MDHGWYTDGIMHGTIVDRCRIWEIQNGVCVCAYLVPSDRVTATAAPAVGGLCHSSDILHMPPRKRGWISLPKATATGSDRCGSPVPGSLSA